MWVCSKRTYSWTSEEASFGVESTDSGFTGYAKGKNETKFSTMHLKCTDFGYPVSK
jgi:hypothetical protein